MNLKNLFIIFIVIILLLAIILYSHSEAHFPFYPYINTTFSKNFTWNKFNKVTPGMKKENVLNILGNPLRKFNSGVKDPIECWEYSSDGKLQLLVDFSWYSVKVCYTNDIVSSKPIDEFND